MRILMTNYYGGGVTGTETWTSTVARELRARGHDVRDVCVEWHAREGTREWDEVFVDGWWADEGGWRPDVIHAHHNECARRARKRWPDVPMIYVQHSTFEPLEQVPEDVGFYLVCGVSDEIVDWLGDRVCAESLNMGAVGQPVNVKRFRPRDRIRPRVRHILVVSSRIGRARARLIEEAASYLHAAVKFVGGDYGTCSQGALAQWYNWADVVFSMGRGAWEAMCCGRVPVIFDRFGADGMVTRENARDLARYNFSGRRHRWDWGVQELIMCLGRYEAAEGTALREWAVPLCDVRMVCDDLTEMYKEAITYGYQVS